MEQCWLDLPFLRGGENCVPVNRHAEEVCDPSGRGRRERDDAARCNELVFSKLRAGVTSQFRFVPRESSV